MLKNVTDHNQHEITLGNFALPFEEVARAYLEGKTDRRRHQALVKLFEQVLSNEIAPPVEFKKFFLDFFKSKYLPPPNEQPVKDTLSKRSHYGYGYTGRLILAGALKEFNVSTEEVALALEKVRYAQFLRSIRRWLREAKTPPPPFQFNVETSKTQVDTFNEVTKQLGLGELKSRKGILKPVWDQNLGFILEVHEKDTCLHRFLIALPDGALLSKQETPRPSFMTHLHLLQGNALLHLLWKVTPIELNAALQPRQIFQYDTKRVTLFKGGLKSSIPAHVSIPAASIDNEVSLEVKGSDLLNGIKQVTLRGNKSKSRLLIVTLEEKEGEITRILEQPRENGKSLGSSRNINIKLNAYVSGASEVAPTFPLLPLWSNRCHPNRIVGVGRAHIKLPTSYPFEYVSAAVWKDSEGITHGGIWAPGVARKYTKPIKSFTISSASDMKIEKETSWLKPPPLGDRLIHTLAEHLFAGNKSAEFQRLFECFEKDPIFFYRMFYETRPEFAIRDRRNRILAFKQSSEFAPLVREINRSLAEVQARSWAYVAAIAALADNQDLTGASHWWANLDTNFVLPADPQRKIAFLRGFAPRTMASTVSALKEHSSVELKEMYDRVKLSGSY